VENADVANKAAKHTCNKGISADKATIYTGSAVTHTDNPGNHEWSAAIHAHKATHHPRSALAHADKAGDLAASRRPSAVPHGGMSLRMRRLDGKGALKRVPEELNHFLEETEVANS